nr:hypothetical protein [uncultured Anaerocolumna sp.]
MAMTDSQKAIIKCKSTGIIQTILGWIIAVFCGFCTIVGVTQISESFDVAMVLIFLAFTAGGVSLIRKGKKKKKLLKIYQDYSTRLATDATKSIDLLATSVGKPVDAVRKDVVTMINMGLFPNCYINQERNCIVFSQIGTAATYTTSPIHQQVSTLGVEFVTVKCPGCGATNKITRNTVNECEYCGAQISDK